MLKLTEQIQTPVKSFSVMTLTPDESGFLELELELERFIFHCDWLNYIYT